MRGQSRRSFLTIILTIWVSEGPSDDPVVLAARALRKRNLLATLFLSQGVPMWLMGDEIGHSGRQ